MDEIELGRHIVERSAELAELEARGEFSPEAAAARQQELALTQTWLCDAMRAQLEQARAEYAAWWHRTFGDGG